MARLLSHRQKIQFDFVGYSEHVSPGRPADDRLFLDAGNALGPGVIDHHQLAAYLGSTSGLVLRHPELVSESIRADRDPSDPFTIVVHQYPDLDCLVASYLAICILVDGQLPPSAAALSSYADRVDAGHSGFTQDRPFTLYSAYLLLTHDLGSTGRDGWRESLARGLEVVGYVAEKVSQANVSIFDVDAFACERIFKPRDRREVENDLNRYRSKLADSHCACRRIRLPLPGEFGGTRDVDALLARHVQDVEDPERCIYFKDWARSDAQNSPSGRGFTALSVFMSDRAQRAIGPADENAADQPDALIRRAILSVAPGEGVSLRGLGEMLDQAESLARIERFQVDDRVIDPRSGEPRTPRPGYANADPWYDGRGHNGTIVDSPRSGTLLPAERIEEIFVAFGTRGSQPSESSLVPAPADESTDGGPAPTTESVKGSNPPVSPRPSGMSQPPAADTPQTLARMSSLVDHWRKERPPTVQPTPALEVFISYSRTCLEWVEANVANPLADARGGGMVFFDKHHLNAGMDWLATLADSVMACRLFLPIYCPAYFRSDFCQWELQLAVTRDPTGRKRIITPFVLEPATLPAYCRLIQAQDIVTAHAKERIVRLVNEVLG